MVRGSALGPRLALAVEPSSSNAHAILRNLELEAGRLDAERIAYCEPLREDLKIREAASQLEKLAQTTPKKSAAGTPGTRKPTPHTGIPTP